MKNKSFRVVILAKHGISATVSTHRLFFSAVKKFVEVQRLNPGKRITVLPCK